MQVKQLFPRDGSKLTPPHPSGDFKFKDYCPAAFRQLRAVFDLDSAEYMLSICGETQSSLSAAGQCTASKPIPHSDNASDMKFQSPCPGNLTRSCTVLVTSGRIQKACYVMQLKLPALSSRCRTCSHRLCLQIYRPCMQSSFMGSNHK